MKTLTTREAIKAPTPTNQAVVDRHDEVRLDLPFGLFLENLTYIGVILDNQTWQVRPHYHEHFEMCYVAEGQGWFAMEDLLYEVSQGDLFLTLPGEVHRGAAISDQPFRLYYLGFQLEQLRGIEVDFYGLKTRRVSHQADPPVKSLFDQILAEARDSRPHAAQMVQALFVQLMVTVLRAYHAPGTSQATVLSQPLKEVLNFLHTQAGPDLDLANLARQVNFSPSQLARQFKQQFGVSLTAYNRAVCLDQAKQYLTTTNLSVSQIADRLNFSSIHSFSIFFKRHTGFAPEHYRKTASL